MCQGLLNIQKGLAGTRRNCLLYSPNPLSALPNFIVAPTMYRDTLQPRTDYCVFIITH